MDSNISKPNETNMNTEKVHYVRTRFLRLQRALLHVSDLDIHISYYDMSSHVVFFLTLINTFQC